eukprot:NODE_525_length_1644_cov_110.946708_g436_i0.p1 GENE.NODE_525_length_1644_cov_110.946708_g436_i0~~NODE_525_length_1644_cov_110.946708_g436_i0.p1  ORF type:complete len:493 (+),score=93.49 NODE_525_length_1644_cov_110.946708_g436_i0:29-1507(+)
MGLLPRLWQDNVHGTLSNVSPFKYLALIFVLSLLLAGLSSTAYAIYHAPLEVATAAPWLILPVLMFSAHALTNDTLHVALATSLSFVSVVAAPFFLPLRVAFLWPILYEHGLDVVGSSSKPLLLGMSLVLSKLLWLYWGVLLLLASHTYIERFLVNGYVLWLNSGRDPTSMRSLPPGWLSFPTFGVALARMSINSQFCSAPSLAVVQRGAVGLGLLLFALTGGAVVRAALIPWVKAAARALSIPPVELDVEFLILHAALDVLLVHFVTELWMSLEAARQLHRVMGRRDKPLPDLTDEPFCRICREGPEWDPGPDPGLPPLLRPDSSELLHPCDCEGSIALAHRACLQRWLAHSSTPAVCEVCCAALRFQRVPLAMGTLWWATKGVAVPFICHASLLLSAPTCVVMLYAGLAEGGSVPTGRCGVYVSVALHLLLRLAFRTAASAHLHSALTAGSLVAAQAIRLAMMPSEDQGVLVTSGVCVAVAILLQQCVTR